MRVSDVKREYQLQEWSGMLRECKESGLTVKNWCAERGITEHAYYYRLRKLRQAACDALQQAQPELCLKFRFLWCKRNLRQLHRLRLLQCVTSSPAKLPQTVIIRMLRDAALRTHQFFTVSPLSLRSRSIPLHSCS